MASCPPSSLGAGEQLQKWDPGGPPSLFPLEPPGGALMANRLALS